MLTNRSAPPATVTPVLVYLDVRAAVEWLVSAFGFEEKVRIGDAHRAQLRVGADGAVVVADVRGGQVAPSDGVVTHLIKIRVPDVDAAFAHAREHGARVVEDLETWEYGERWAWSRISRVTGGSSRRRSETPRRTSGAARPSHPGDVLELRPNCELCDQDLPPQAEDARICSYECTFCAACVETVLHDVCPNCGGGFQPRPIRPMQAWRDDTGLQNDPAGTARRRARYTRDEMSALTDRLRSVPPSER